MLWKSSGLNMVALDDTSGVSKDLISDILSTHQPFCV